MNQDIVDATQSGISVMDISFYGICVPKCPAKSTYICDYETQVCTWGSIFSGRYGWGQSEA
jgi:hypothetical protein